MMAICWGIGHHTPIHDHNGQEGWIKVIDGMVEESLYRVHMIDEDTFTAELLKADQFTKTLLVMLMTKLHFIALEI